MPVSLKFFLVVVSISTKRLRALRGCGRVVTSPSSQATGKAQLTA